MVELETSSTFRGWVRVRVLGYGSGVRGRKVKSRDCALASDLVRARTIGGLDPWCECRVPVTLCNCNLIQTVYSRISKFFGNTFDSLDNLHNCSSYSVHFPRSKIFSHSIT